MTKAYTNITDVKIDLEMYVALRTGSALDLSLFPALAKQRYPWIVDNWGKLYTIFKNYSNGDQNLEDALSDFDSSVRGYKLSTSANPLNVLDNPDKFDLYSDFLELIDVRGIGLNAAESSLVANEAQRVAKLTIDDFRSMLQFINNFITLSSSQLGLYDPEGFSALGAPQASKTKSPTINDLSVIDQQLDIKKYVESIILSLKSTISRPPDLLKAANANTSGGNVTINDSYLSSVSVPFSGSLEQMAADYMGDKRLWYELVTVNNLQPPYVDEVGIKYLLVAPGAGNNVTISSDSQNDLHVGASLSIGSVAVREEARSVNRISYNSDNTMVLFLSGAADMSKFKKDDGAFVRIYAPHTINGKNFIKIPVNLAATLPTGMTPQKDELRRLDAALLNFGVDISEDETTGDISLAPNGNFLLAYGLKNVKQSVRNAINTVKGELPFHPRYGLDSTIGSKMFGPGDQALFVSEMVQKAILKDRRIVSATINNLTFTGTSVSMLVLVQIQGSSQIIPLSFVG